MNPLKAMPACLLVLLALLVAPAVAADLTGLPITSIILQDDRGNPWPEPEGLLPLMEVKPGDRFSPDAVRRGIGYLYLKGLFRDVRVDAFGEDSGVRLEYTLSPITIVEGLVLRGNRALRNRVVLETIRGVEGRELREENFPDIRAGIQARYQADGFYNVRVDFRSAPTPKPYRVLLYLYITEPKRTVIEQVRFSGNTVLKDEDLIAVMKNRPGKPLLTDVLLDADQEAIRRAYADAGHPAAQPGPVSMSFQDGKAFIEIAVKEGPKVTVTFTGNRRFSERKLRNMLLIGTEHDVSESVIESSADKIRIAYRDQGYADVRVDTSRREGPGTLDLQFSVSEGPRLEVAMVRIEGNHSFTEKQIRAMLETRASGWFRSRYFREDLLERDRDYITDQYIAAGYAAAEVKSAVTRTQHGVEIVLTITEGVRTITGNVLFSGNAVLSPAELSGVLKLVTGAPFNERLLEEDRYRMQNLYAERGYLYARIEADRQPPAEGRPAAPAGPRATEVVDIRYRISEDREVRIGKVILRGNAFTRDSVIQRELDPKPGEPYNYEAILKSQQRVYRYGYFSLARFEPVHGQEKEYVRDMLFTVEERPAGSVEFGIGYGDLDRLRGFFEVSHRNLWSSAHYASLRLEGSDILTRAALTYRMPWFLGKRNWESRTILAWSDSKRINQDTRDVYYQTRKTSASYGVERLHSPVKPSLTYQFENVDNYNVQQAAELTPEDSGRVLISSLTPAVVWDLRDNIFDPRRGSVHGITVKEAMSLLGSKADFTKATVQTTWFFPVKKLAVLALSARAGRAWPHKDTPEVPIHERFYLGGGTTVRGYPQDSIGPPGDEATSSKIPTGGTSMVQLNAEVRFGSAEGFGVVLFSDAGNVWVNERILFNGLRSSYGAGIRYHTPVGPLRIDYGQKIHRLSGETPGELHFNIGHAF